MENINNRYKIIKKIDEGAMGIIYRAEDVFTEENLVLKIINMDSSETPSLENFKKEYNILKQLKHPYIVQVNSFTEIWSIDQRMVLPKYYLISMENIKGRNLKEAVLKITSREEWIRVIKQSIETLNYIHFNGIQHNDIRSNNIYLTDTKKNIKFLDFGISEFLEKEKKINRIKKASDWKNLFLLFQDLIKDKDHKSIKKFIKKALGSFNFKKGFESRGIVDFFNNSFKNHKITPGWIKYNPDVYLTPKNSGIIKKYNRICSFIEKDSLKEKILFIIGDEYTEALLLYFRALDFFQYKNYIPIKIRASNIIDTLFSIVSRIQNIDVEENSLKEYSDLSKQVLNRDSTLLDGNKKFITYNKMTQFLKSVSQEVNLLFDIPKYGMLTDYQIEFFNFLLNSTNLSNISWIFYDTLRSNSFEKYINQTHYDIKFFDFDFISKKETKYILQTLLLLNQKELDSSSNLIKTIHKKANGKFLSIIRFIHYLFQKNFIFYVNGRYSYDLKEIEKCEYSFSYERELNEILSSLSKEEKNVLALQVFINRNTEISTIEHIFGEKKIDNALNSLIEKNLLQTINQKGNKLVKIRHLTFKHFCQKELDLNDKSKKRAISKLISSLSDNNSLAEIYFIIIKLYSMQKKKPYLLIKYISLLLDKFIRDVYRKEVKKSISILEEIHTKVSKKYFYNLSKLKIAIFYYFNLEHDKAINIFNEIDLNYLKLKSKLDYYLNFSKANIFTNNVDIVKKLLREGNILAKNNKLRNYRFFLFNVKGMLYARLNKNNLSISYFDLVYKYVLKNGFHQEIINFANNYFLILYRLNKTNKIINRAEKLLKTLNKSKYENKKATIYIYDQLARVNRKNNNLKKALEYRNKAYDIAYNIQNIDEMIQMKENNILPKYYLNYDKDIIISDLQKVINLSIKYKREEQAITSYGNLIILYIETGNISKALEYYNKSVSFFDLEKLEYLKYFFVLQRGITVYSELGAKDKTLSLFKKYYSKLKKLKKNRFMIHKIEYLDTKCMYYYTFQKYNKFLIWQKKYQKHYNYLKSNDILSFSRKRQLQLYLDKIEVLHLLNKKDEKNKFWEKIKEKFGDIDKKIDHNSEINYNYYTGLMEENITKKRNFLKKAVDHIIKHKNYINIENIIQEYLKCLKNNSFDYYNAIIILLISFKKFYNNVPKNYSYKWLKKQNIQETLKLLADTTDFSKEKIKSKETASLVSKLKISFLKKMNIKIDDIQQVNNIIWNSLPENYLDKICTFLKDSFFATRLILKVNDNIKIEKTDKHLYSRNTSIKKELIENSYIKGDFVIENNYSFGDPISTIVIPVINPYNKNLYKNRDKRSKSISYHDYYFGYIYIDSKYPLSNIQSSTINFLKSFIEFISLYVTYEKTHKELVLDNLTNLYTREHFLQLLKRKFSHAKKKNYNSLFLLIDIDYFKQINDTLGHQKGDEVLEKIASIIKQNIRTNDLIGRYGGEEFIVFMENIKYEEAKIKADNIRKKIQNSKILPDRKITISIGCSMFPQDSRWINILINQADIAMYNAKKTGRNKVFFWDENLKIQKTKTNLLTGIVTDDLMRSKHIIRNFIELLNYKNKSFNSLMSFFIKKLKYLIPNKYHYINISINDNNYESISKNISLKKNDFTKIDSNRPKIFINWDCFKTKENIIYNDLFYKMETKNITGVLIFSISTNTKNYTIGDKNLLDKIVKLLKLKINNLD